MLEQDYCDGLSDQSAIQLSDHGARSSHGLEFPTKPSFRIGPNCGPCKPSLPSICPEVGNAVTLIQEIPLEGSILLNDS
jgi:hypothetical protein